MHIKFSLDITMDHEYCSSLFLFQLFIYLFCCVVEPSLSLYSCTLIVLNIKEQTRRNKVATRSWTFVCNPNSGDCKWCQICCSLWVCNRRNLGQFKKNTNVATSTPLLGIPWTKFTKCRRSPQRALWHKQVNGHWQMAINLGWELR